MIGLNTGYAAELGKPWLDLIGVYLDNSHWRISAKRAGMVCREYGSGRLPRHGYEQLIVREGRKYWLGRTVHEGRQMWCLHAVGRI